MLSLAALVSAALLVVSATAQAPTTNFSSTEITAILGEVSLSLRNSWCQSQYNICGELCGGFTNANNCSGTDLTYSCLCQSNNSAPALQYYQDSIIFYICEQGYADCISANVGSQAGQQGCNVTYVCGHANASDVGASTTTTTSSASAAATPSATGSPSASASPSKAAAAALVQIGAEYGTGIFAAGLFAILGFAL